MRIKLTKPIFGHYGVNCNLDNIIGIKHIIEHDRRKIRRNECFYTGAFIEKVIFKTC